MQRVAMYVDGFNLYFGLKDAGFKRYYWLDLDALARKLLRPGQQLVATHYFTARIRDNGRNAADRKRQSDYIEALQARNIQCQFGHFLPKTRRCFQCGASWPAYEEKMTDVNLAIQFVVDAFDDQFDTALVLSADSDLSTPIRRVLTRFPEKRIVSIFPPKRHSAELIRCASAYLKLGRGSLQQSQLPEQMTKPDGHVLTRPVTWR